MPKDAGDKAKKQRTDLEKSIYSYIPGSPVVKLPMQRGVLSVPGQGTKIPPAVQCGQ